MKFVRSQSTTRRAKRSMQYYRLWIYSCNAVLAVSSAAFAICAVFFLSDVRLSLLGGVQLYHPTFLYAYVALILQCGVLQTLGCLGAQRLNNKLLSWYWILLVLLTIGDVIVGLVWVFKLDKVRLNLRPQLTKDFFSKYSRDESFIASWDYLQATEHCCGVDGPQDYYQLSSSSYSRPKSIPLNASFIIDLESRILSLPESCCFAIHDSPSVSGGSGFPHSLNSATNDHFYSTETKVSRSYPSDQHWDTSWDDGGGHDHPIASTPPIYHQDQFESDKNDYVLDEATPSPPPNPFIGEVPDGQTPGLVKHKVRHGIHRLKLPSTPPEQDDGEDNSPKQLALGTHLKTLQSSERNKNKTTVKPTSQRIPSFSYPNTKGVGHAPIPFTCQRYRRQGESRRNYDDNPYPSNSKSNNDNNNNNNNGKEPGEIRPEPSASGLRDDQGYKNDHQSSWKEFQESNRRKRNSHVSSAPFPDTATSNEFSFLQEEDNRNSISEGDSDNEKTGMDEGAYYLALSSSSDPTNPENANPSKKFHLYKLGCGWVMSEWVDHTSGILFILGFCIIGFVKVCFVVILRTEIREMIDKIQMMELENPASPSKSHCKDQRFNSVSHPLLTNPHRPSTVSAHACNAALPTIKSPEGQAGGPSRLFTKHYQQRRHSNIIGDRSSTHSQETVNMTLFVTNSGTGGGVSESKPEKGRSNPNLRDLLFRDELIDPLSITVPNTAKYLRRSSTCSASAQSSGGYTYYHYDDSRPGPSSRLYFHDPPYYPLHHQHHHHGYQGARARLYSRNMSIGAVVPHSNATASVAAAFRSLSGGESGAGSGNCSMSSRDENEVLSVSMENVVVVENQRPPTQDEEKAKERREKEIRDWAASTACTDLPKEGESGVTETETTTISLGDYNKQGFNRSSDSNESNDRNTRGRNGNNNNMDVESMLPLSYLGTAV